MTYLQFGEFRTYWTHYDTIAVIVAVAAMGVIAAVGVCVIWLTRRVYQ